jgi:hypothetical protein
MFETDWEGDSIREISENEQFGAKLRERTGIGTRYQITKK